MPGSGRCEPRAHPRLVRDEDEQRRPAGGQPLAAGRASGGADMQRSRSTVVCLRARTSTGILIYCTGTAVLQYTPAAGGLKIVIFVVLVGSIYHIQLYLDTVPVVPVPVVLLEL